ncbi:hypothetical protein JR316_0002709 [Psilocybe cubensis]|uniref:Uncharacterized protein n=2 Tax=Psilocybe cubensis TaxID=181762 RepID=A0ACB8HF38_PSICU|nr:hypothetical protein JR316_0002709 [Psilocybe cubensis]KAH9485794.1 hypothetical protein JR316_0002709 [Psilocybe cubensis]
MADHLKPSPTDSADDSEAVDFTDSACNRHPESAIVQPCIESSGENPVFGSKDAKSLEPSKYESIQDIVSSASTTDTKEMPCAVKEVLISDEEEAREIVHFATWLMEEQKARMSLPNLNDAVALFRKILDGCRSTHPSDTKALKDLPSALNLRFMHTNQLSDLVEGFKLRFEGLPSMINQMSAQNVDNLADQGEVSTTSELGASELAHASLDDFNKSVSLSALESIIVLLRLALQHLVFPDATRTQALSILVNGLCARRHYYGTDTMVDDLNEEIASLKDAIQSSTDWKQNDRLALRTATLLLERYSISADVSDVRSALGYLRDYSNYSAQKLQSAIELLKAFSNTQSIGDLNTAIQFFHEGISDVPQGSEHYDTVISHLANAHVTMVWNQGELYSFSLPNPPPV